MIYGRAYSIQFSCFALRFDDVKRSVDLSGVRSSDFVKAAGAADQTNAPACSRWLSTVPAVSILLHPLRILKSELDSLHVIDIDFKDSLQQHP